MKKTLIFLIIFSTYLHSTPFIMLSIPKCGTQLIKKTLILLTKDKKILPLPKEPLFIHGHFFFPPLMNVNAEQFLEKYPQFPGQSMHAHLNYSFLFREFITKYPEYAAFIMIRDLRDALVSMAYFYRFPRSIGTIEEKITFLMNIDDSSVWSLKSQAKEALNWMKDPHATIIRFENLIGPKGGGTQEFQDAELFKIAHALSIPLDDAQLKYARNHMWGNTWTFRKGEIGEWKTHFTDHHKALFKNKLGDLLIALGYEKNDDW